MSATNARPIQAAELSLGLPDGNRIAVKMWGPEHAELRVLCLHGWLDNAASWDRLAPLLVRSGRMRVVAMDFTGHGLSSHKSRDATYAVEERIIEVLSVADALRWDTFRLMGHSMGGGIATLVAAAAPSRVTGLVLVDIIGSWPSPVPGFIEPLQDGVLARSTLMSKQRRVYRSLDDAVSRYLVNNPLMKAESARILLERATEQVEVDGMAVAEDRAEAEALAAVTRGGNNEAPAPRRPIGGGPWASAGDSSLPRKAREAAAGGAAGAAAAAAAAAAVAAAAAATQQQQQQQQQQDGGAERRSTGVCFRHDPRLMGRALIHLTQDQNLLACRAIQCPVLLLMASNPLRRRAQRPGGSAHWMLKTFGDRAAAVKDCTLVVIESSHHLHLDNAEDIQKLVGDFLIDPALIPNRGVLQPIPPYTPADDVAAVQIARSRL